MTKPPFSRSDFDRGKLAVLHAGRWANPDLLRFDGPDAAWVIKDFGTRPATVRQSIGRFMVRREWRALCALQGMDGFPRETFRLDAHALCYRFEPGNDLKHANPALFDTDFFLRLESLVHEMHARGIVHLDLRHGTNILRRDDGGPVIIDFQSCLFLRYVPACLHRILKDVDLSGVYKEWQRKVPDTLDGERLALLERLRRQRRYWVLRGYSVFGLQRRCPEAATREHRSNQDGQ